MSFSSAIPIKWQDAGSKATKLDNVIWHKRKENLHFWRWLRKIAVVFLGDQLMIFWRLHDVIKLFNATLKLNQFLTLHWECISAPCVQKPLMKYQNFCSWNKTYTSFFKTIDFVETGAAIVIIAYCNKIRFPSHTPFLICPAKKTKIGTEYSEIRARRKCLFKLCLSWNDIKFVCVTRFRAVIGWIVFLRLKIISFALQRNKNNVSVIYEPNKDMLCRKALRRTNTEKK